MKRSTIEGDQNQVAAFSLEYFSNLTRSAWAYENASNQSAKAGRLIKNEPHAFSWAQAERVKFEKYSREKAAT